MALEPTSELEAVNAILRSVGEAHITSLDADFADAESALGVLRETSRKVQEEGWSWNTEHCFEITPNGSGYLQLPSNALKVDPEDARYVARGARLYDARKHTFVATASTRVRLTVGLDWDDLPQVARTYITARAIREFQANEQGSDTASAVASVEEVEARARLEAAEADTSDANVLADNLDVAMTTRAWGQSPWQW